MPTWAGVTFAASFAWIVLCWGAAEAAQHRIFFRHYAERVGPLPKPYDESRLIRSALARGLFPRNARRYMALRTPLADEWLDRRRRVANLLQWSWVVGALLGAFLIASITIRLFA